MSSWLHLCIAGAILLAVLLLFSPTFAYPFLNWDDQEVFVRNTALHGPGLVGWAFTTTFIEHYQPVAWLAWGAVDRLWGLTPGAAHVVNVCLHALCSGLVFALARRVGAGVGASAGAALLFALHPLRVEVVAWASAMPYALALLFALLSTLAYLAARDDPRLIPVSLALFALSLLARPIALGLPVVLFALDWSLGMDKSRRPGVQSVRRLAPFAVLAVAAAYVESTARVTATVFEVGVGARLTLALTAPFRYLWRTVVPVGLTPLDPLAVAPRSHVLLIVACGAALIAISWMAWRRRGRYPRTATAWVSYLALLVPATGLIPSGLQATADRYMYVAAVPISIWIGGAIRPGIFRGVVAPAAIVAIAGLAVLSYNQTRHWRDSIALWSRAVAVDPTNDVALYNLASALDEAGRREEALARYEEVLRIVPDQGDARKNRDLIVASALEAEANRLAASGQLDDAIARYRRALALDPARAHSRAALGMALVQTGRTTEAVGHLREANARGAAEAAIPNALAFSLVKEGRTREACDVLAEARARFPGDRDVARNLAQLSRECAR